MTQAVLSDDDSRVPAEPTGTRIAKRRHVLGLSQEQLAALVGVRRDTVSAWERDKQFPHRHLGKLEQVLGLDLSEPEPDPVVQEIRDLGTRLGLTPAEQDALIARHLANRAPPDGVRRAG